MSFVRIVDGCLRAVRSMSQNVRQPVRPGFVTPMRSVPSHIKCPDYYLTGNPAPSPRTTYVADSQDIDKIRKAGRLARRILDFACANSKPGITTEQLDILCHEEIIRLQAYPSPINYAGFPKAICTSVNDVVCHGIPDDRVLQDGDVLSIDVSIFKDGFHGDNCGTIIVGKPLDSDSVRLVNTTREAMETAVSMCKPGACLTVVGETIHQIASREKFSIIHEFCGHGVGPSLHMKPLVMHQRNDARLKLQKGMIFTIEPILVEGSRRMLVWDDDWTAITMDGGRGAQFEHQILITDDGAEILTIPE